MNKEIVRDEKLGEEYSVIHHRSGLDILVYKMQDFTTAQAMFATKYGSINTCFKTKNDNDFVTVPEGIAHYLEHKLFENEDSNVFDLYSQTGAIGNAYTSADETVYYFTCTDNFEKSLRILLNFVRNPYFTDETVAKEQGIIAQEIKMYDDSPERKCFTNLLKTLFVKHPVRVDIAGTVESIAEITPELLYKCYNTFYNLHNMVLCIAGNVDEQKIVDICDEMLDADEDLKLETKIPDEPSGVVEKRITASFPVGLPVFNIGFKSESCAGIEYEKKCITASICMKLLAGSSSPLYKKLFDEGLINSQFGSENYSGSGSFFCTVFFGESKNPDEVYSRLLNEIERVKNEGFEQELFDIAKKSRYGSYIRGLNNVENCADAMLESYFNGSLVFDEIKALEELTAEDCRKALYTIFDKKNSAISIAENNSVNAEK